MSVQLTPQYDFAHRVSRPIEEIARETRIDACIPNVVPGFDAPFFESGASVSPFNAQIPDKTESYASSKRLKNQRPGVLLGANRDAHSDLRKLVEIWPRLSDSMRVGILTIATTSYRESHGGPAAAHER